MALPGLFVNVRKDEEAGKKVGGLQRGTGVRNDGCARTGETRVEGGRGSGVKKKIWPIYHF